MEEVRRVIQHRNGIAPVTTSAVESTSPVDFSDGAEESARNIENLIAEADRHLEDIINHEGEIEAGLEQLASDHQKVCVVRL